MSEEIENIIEEILSPDRYCLVHNYIVSLQQKVEQLEKQNKELLKKSYSDDARMTKAVEFIKEEQQLTDIDEVINTDILLNILNKGDNE